ncbi:MAG TPA: ABC transporter ATP-binding protein [Candidatus Binatia bacterium]|nr:ABC transporter ATP-binding protein [Candidatus Binatia bacterium]
MSRPILELRDVEKRFPGRAQPVLSGVDLAVREGELVAVVGCSGAGKTTLVSLAAGLLAPERGEILFDGHPVCGPGPERAVVFQSYSLLPWMSALQNVMLAVRASAPELGRSAARERAREVLELVKLGAAVDRRPGELSGGMRQRVALARGLAMRPRLLLLDEPLSALDALTRAALQDELARIRSATHTTTILVTNDIDEAILLADVVHPLTRGPAARLLPAIPIEIPRPRARTRMSLAPGYQRARRAIVAALGARSARARHDAEPRAGSDAARAAVAESAR